MKTQVEQIASAKFAYIVPLSEHSSTSGTQRFAIYLAGPSGELGVLWPGDADIYDNLGMTRKKPNLLPGQVYWKSSGWKYPAFHFRLSGFGYSKGDKLRRMLREHNPSIEVSVLRGASPCPASYC